MAKMGRFGIQNEKELGLSEPLRWRMICDRVFFLKL